MGNISACLMFITFIHERRFVTEARHYMSPTIIKIAFFLSVLYVLVYSKTNTHYVFKVLLMIRIVNS
jgi:hypothetical protein